STPPASPASSGRRSPWLAQTPVEARAALRPAVLEELFPAMEEGARAASPADPRPGRPAALPTRKSPAPLLVQPAGRAGGGDLQAPPFLPHTSDLFPSPAPLAGSNRSSDERSLSSQPPGRKYPAISSPEEREKYKAVFYDQHAEYRELHGEVRAALQKFQELDAMMGRLPWRARSRQEQSRVSNVCKEYKKKRSDPAFLEKQERCAYLKKKLTHLKAQIQDYDCRVQEGAVYF
uniref:Occludin/ELL domain containing 1 n=1 Tax=Crocodylus porosus TaxID=8502 RepID=A0A7M4FQW6_CROPO